MDRRRSASPIRGGAIDGHTARRSEALQQQQQHQESPPHPEAAAAVELASSHSHEQQLRNSGRANEASHYDHHDPRLNHDDGSPTTTIGSSTSSVPSWLRHHHQQQHPEPGYATTHVDFAHHPSQYSSSATFHLPPLPAQPTYTAHPSAVPVGAALQAPHAFMRSSAESSTSSTPALPRASWPISMSSTTYHHSDPPASTTTATTTGSRSPSMSTGSWSSSIAGSSSRAVRPDFDRVAARETSPPPVSAAPLPSFLTQRPAYTGYASSSHQPSLPHEIEASPFAYPASSASSSSGGFDPFRASGTRAAVDYRQGSSVASNANAFCPPHHPASGSIVYGSTSQQQPRLPSMTSHYAPLSPVMSASTSNGFSRSPLMPSAASSSSSSSHPSAYDRYGPAADVGLNRGAACASPAHTDTHSTHAETMLGRHSPAHASSYAALPPLQFSLGSQAPSFPALSSAPASAHSASTRGTSVSSIASSSTSAAPVLENASRLRAELRASQPVLAYNPAREPSSTAKAIVQRDGVKYALASDRSTASNGGRVKAKQAEVPAMCWTCGETRAKLMLRGSDVEFGPSAHFTCLKCLPVETNDDGSTRQPRFDESYGGRAMQDQDEEARVTYADTMSAEIDRIEGREVVVPVIEVPTDTGKNLPAHIKKQAFTCDVCDRIIGAGQITSSERGPMPSFTVEVLCVGCLERYKPCSDCGGGGGRLTPGRWRCKELFPAGRRTCQLSHARNPPLLDMVFEVFPIVDIHPEKLEQLEARCRLIYFNTRLRTTARPEMLERGDGLATTFQQAENQCIDQWSLLSQLFREDIEESRLIRRYVALHSATPHRRRTKPKVKREGDSHEVSPALEDDDAPLEKEVTGFTLVEHDLPKGAIFFAVVMPWALSGDAFEATTILTEEAVRKIKSELASLNALRAQQGLAEYPLPNVVWGVTPFKIESRMSQSLNRRGYLFFDDFCREYPDTDKTAFPPHRQTHIPPQFMASFNIFARRIHDGDELGGTSNVPKKGRPRGGIKRARSET